MLLKDFPSILRHSFFIKGNWNFENTQFFPTGYINTWQVNSFSTINENEY